MSGLCGSLGVLRGHLVLSISYRSTHLPQHDIIQPPPIHSRSSCQLSRAPSNLDRRRVTIMQIFSLPLFQSHCDRNQLITAIRSRPQVQGTTREVMELMLGTDNGRHQSNNNSNSRNNPSPRRQSYSVSKSAACPYLHSFLTLHSLPSTPAHSAQHLVPHDRGTAERQVRELERCGADGHCHNHSKCNPHPCQPERERRLLADLVQ